MADWVRSFVSRCRFFTRFCFLSTVLVLAGCAPEVARNPQEVRVDNVTVFVSSESELLGRPADIAVGENGSLYIVDVIASQVLVLSVDGELIRTIGGEGSGPREFKNPYAFALTADSLRVADVGNARLQVFALRGDFTRTVRLPAGSNMGPIAVAYDGRFLTTALGMPDALALYHDPSGKQLGTLGAPPAPVSGVASPAQLKQQIIDGEVPAMFRNAVLPVFAPGGDMWLILTGEGALRRFGEDGSLQLSVPLEAPEMQEVWQECVERAKATPANPRSVAGLFYVWDATVLGQTLWVLLNTTEDGPAVLMAFTGDGEAKERILFSGVRGARSFAFDRQRDRVFFAIPSTASILASSVPSGILGM